MLVAKLNKFVPPMKGPVTYSCKGYMFRGDRWQRVDKETADYLRTLHLVPGRPETVKLFVIMDEDEARARDIADEAVKVFQAKDLPKEVVERLSVTPEEPTSEFSSRKLDEQPDDPGKPSPAPVEMVTMDVPVPRTKRKKVSKKKAAKAKRA